jgi:hypothetical protein
LKNRPVRFRFYKPEIEKTKPNPNRKKPRQTEKTELNRFESVFVLKTEPNRFEPIFVLKNRTEPKPGFELISVPFRFKKKFWFGYLLKKNRTKPKMITPNIIYPSSSWKGYIQGCIICD